MAAFKIILILAVCLIAAVKAGVEEYALKETNRLRWLHESPPLELSSTWTAQAQKYAQVLADKGKLEHSSEAGKRYGENLCLTSESPLKCIQMWYDEIKDYDFDKPGYSDKTGHFTQLLWASSVQMGYGQARSKSGIYYVVAIYYPRGNLKDSFDQDVPRLGGGAGGSGGSQDTTTKSKSSKITLSVNVLIISICFGLFKLAY